MSKPSLHVPVVRKPSNEHTQRIMHTRSQQIAGPRLGCCNANYEHAQRIMHTQTQSQQIVGPRLGCCNAHTSCDTTNYACAMPTGCWPRLGCCIAKVLRCLNMKKFPSGQSLSSHDGPRVLLVLARAVLRGLAAPRLITREHPLVGGPPRA